MESIDSQKHEKEEDTESNEEQYSATAVMSKRKSYSMALSTKKRKRRMQKKLKMRNLTLKVYIYSSYSNMTNSIFCFFSLYAFRDFIQTILKRKSRSAFSFLDVYALLLSKGAVDKDSPLYSSERK